MRNIMRNILRGPILLCVTLCAAPATLQYIMRGLCMTGVLLCAALCATLCADSSHYARNAYSALCPPWLSTPPALRLSNNPSFVHTHHGMAEPANATNISCHSQVEARIIWRIISRIISAHNVAHNNYSVNLMTSGYKHVQPSTFCPAVAVHLSAFCGLSQIKQKHIAQTRAQRKQLPGRQVS